MLVRFQMIAHQEREKTQFFYDLYNIDLSVKLLDTFFEIFRSLRHPAAPFATKTGATTKAATCVQPLNNVGIFKWHSWLDHFVCFRLHQSQQRVLVAKPWCWLHFLFILLCRRLVLLLYIIFEMLALLIFFIYGI